MIHRSLDDLRSGLTHVREAPDDGGEILLLVSRPGLKERRRHQAVELSVEDGLVGDNWSTRGSRHTADGAPERARQLTVMGARAAALIAGSIDPADWMPAGDQLFVDLDLSLANLPAGSQLQVGGALIRVSEEPHTGCAKFVDRYGSDALRFVSTAEGKELRLRGLNAVIVEGGRVMVGDRAVKVGVSVPA